MKNFNEMCLEKRLGKYLFSKELYSKKSINISKSPPPTIETKSPESKYDKDKFKSIINPFTYDDNLFIPIFNDNNDPFLFESNINLKDNPFLSNIEKNSHFTMKVEAEKKTNSYMKITSKITINNNRYNLGENSFEQKIDTSLFNDAFINTDILYDEGILNAFSVTNQNYTSKNKSKENITNTKIINSTEKENKNNDDILVNLSEKERIVIEALKTLDKDYYKDGKDYKENFEINVEENSFESIYNMDSKYSSLEEILVVEQKKNMYEIINYRINQYYNFYKKYKTYELKDKDELKDFKGKISDILLFEQDNEVFKFFSFKSIVIGLYILVINWLSNSHFKIYLDHIKEKNISMENNNNSDASTNNSLNLDIFIELMDKYNTIKDICSFLEKDFKDIIDNFQQKANIKFCLCELLTDLYWDYVFKIHDINNLFTSGYSIDNIKKNIIFEEAKHSMKMIIDILIVYETPYKKNIGEILDLPYMKNNKNAYLMSYIIKIKKSANPFDIKNSCIPSDDNSKNNKKTNTEVKKEKNTKINEKKNTENFSLDEIYKYIQGDSDSKKGKKKNRKKKKKNKNEDKENENNNNVETIDPVVEEFIKYFIEFNRKNINCVKIKPVISQEWIESIS